MCKCKLTKRQLRTQVVPNWWQLRSDKRHARNVSSIACANNLFWWIQNPLPPSVFSRKEQACLAEAIYFEARSEPEDGQAAVALYTRLRSADGSGRVAAPWQWLAEDAWRNPAVVTGWQRLVETISADDLAHISTPYQISEAESRQWMLDAGSSTAGYLTPV